MDYTDEYLIIGNTYVIREGSEAEDWAYVAVSQYSSFRDCVHSWTFKDPR